MTVRHLDDSHAVQPLAGKKDVQLVNQIEADIPATDADEDNLAGNG